MKIVSYYIINSLTLYRMVAAPVLAVLAIAGRPEEFKWLLALSFLTDAIDGFLARKFRIAGAWGARIDSIADDLTIAAAITGMIMFHPGFLRQHIVPLVVLGALWIVQVSFSLYRYRKMSGFHTWLAKIAAVMQGIFLVLVFFLPQPVPALFYTAVIITAADLIEEIILVIMLPEWKNDVKGLYWVLKKGH